MLSLTLDTSAKTSSNVAFRGCFCSSWSFRNTHYMLNLMKISFKNLGLKTTLYYSLNNWKFFMWLVLCLTFNNSAKSLSNSTFWGCFGILRKSRIQNCHWNLIFSKNSLRKTGKRPRQVKVDRLYISMNSESDDHSLSKDTKDHYDPKEIVTR